MTTSYTPLWLDSFLSVFPHVPVKKTKNKKKFFTTLSKRKNPTTTNSTLYDVHTQNATTPLNISILHPIKPAYLRHTKCRIQLYDIQLPLLPLFLPPLITADLNVIYCCYYYCCCYSWVWSNTANKKYHSYCLLVSLFKRSTHSTKLSLSLSLSRLAAFLLLTLHVDCISLALKSYEIH